MKLPDDPNSTVNRIFKFYESLNDGGLRDHLGASLIGDKCERKLFYTFRWATYVIHSGRMQRLFQRGQFAESIFKSDLTHIGCKVFTEDSDGSQFRFEALGGHFGGSCDGIIASGLPEAPKSPHICEMKTHNDKSFTDLQKNGVAESKPNHYAQMQIYMGLSATKWGKENKINRALYIAENKNNDDLHVERIEFNGKAFDALMEKANRIIFTDKAPDRLSDNPQWYECRFCDHYGVCHSNQIPYPSCRSCAFATPTDDGKWLCEKHGNLLSREDQFSGCDHHLINPTMVDGWLNAIDGDDDSIVFEKKGTTEKWTNGISGITTKYAFGLDDKEFLFNEKVQSIFKTFHS